MDCPHCNGKLVVGKASYSVNRKGYHLIIDDVPAFICDQCHEPLFTEEAVELVQEMVHSLDSRRQALDSIRMAA